MNADPALPAQDPGFFRRGLDFYTRETGRSLAFWAVIALLNFITQIIFRHELRLGEFGTLNTVLGVIGLTTVPVLALNQALARYLAQDHTPDRLGRIDSLRAATLLITETFAWSCGVISVLLLFLMMPLLILPRFSLQLFTLLNVLIGLGTLISAAVCRSQNKLRFWGWLLAISSLARVLLGAGLTWSEPWAESGLAAFFLAGFITLIPVLRQQATEAAMRLKALRAALDRDFLLCFSATFSVTLAIFLFTSADRIIAQSWFGAPTNNNINYVDWPMFDAYQTAGLLGRALLWGTQPLLLVLLAQRSRLTRTTAASLTWFWIYLGALLAGAILLGLFRQPLSWLFCGKDFSATAGLVPVFALAMIPLGLLQGLGMFALASRRHPECFVLGGCGIGYTLLLYLVGRQPQLMPAYMFGGGLVVLMVVLFVGVVRWGRRQP